MPTTHAVQPRGYESRSSAFRQTRIAREAAELSLDLTHLIIALPRLCPLGPDHQTEGFAANLGLSTNDVRAIRFCVGDKVATAVGVNGRVWHDPTKMSRLLRLKHSRRSVGDRIVLVPRRIIRREPRRSIARQIARFADKRVDETDRHSVTEHLRASPGASLATCMDLVSDRDPLGTIFALVAEGCVALPLAEPVGPFTRLSLSE